MSEERQYEVTFSDGHKVIFENATEYRTYLVKAIDQGMQDIDIGMAGYVNSGNVDENLRRAIAGCHTGLLAVHLLLTMNNVTFYSEGEEPSHDVQAE